MLLKAIYYGRTAIVAILISLVILAFYCFIPEKSSEEYIYTVKVIFKFAFLPLFILGIGGIWLAYPREIKNLFYFLQRHIKAFKEFLIIHRGPIVLFSLLLFSVLAGIIIYYYPAFIFKAFVSLLPYFCLIGIIWLFRLINPQKGFFYSLIYGSLLWSGVIWLLTNILSWLDMLRGDIIGVFWFLLFMPLLFFLLRYRKAWCLPAIRGWEWVPVIIAFFTLIIGIVYPPNNFDDLGYHLPRVMHWVQNGSLAPYVSSIDRQIGMPPFNAYIILQSYAPFKIDYFVNLGQWLAYIGCMIAVRQITILLGAQKRAINAALIFAATLPAAIVQASTGESCLIVSFYLAIMAWAWLEWIGEKKPSFEMSLIFGLSLGFAILSKGSAYPIALPFVLVIAWKCLRHPKQVFIQGLAAALLVVAINVPHLYRNLSGAGNLVAGGDGNILMHPTPQTFLINSIYNFVSNHTALLANGEKNGWKNLQTNLASARTMRAYFRLAALNMLRKNMYMEASLRQIPRKRFLLFLSC